MKRNEMRDWIGQSMKAKGFHDDGSGFADGGMVRASLVMTEIVEAMQEVKRYWKEPVADAIKDKIAEECADTAIRLYDLSYCHGLDLDEDYGPLEKVRSLGRNERHSLIIRCGKVISVVAQVFDAFEDFYDSGLDNFHGIESFDADAACCVQTALTHLHAMCLSVSRDLTAAIEKKMAENMARPHKYGTPDAQAVAITPSIDGELPAGVPFSFQPIQVMSPSWVQPVLVPVTLGQNGPTIGTADVKEDGTATVTLTDCNAAKIADIKRRILSGESVTLSCDASPDGLKRLSEVLKQSKQAGCDHDSDPVRVVGD